MQVKNFYKNFAKFNSKLVECKENPFNLGDIVINNNTKNISVVVSTINNAEINSDQFGIESTINLSLATLDEVKKYRNNLLHLITKKDLFYNSL